MRLRTLLVFGIIALGTLCEQGATRLIALPSYESDWYFYDMNIGLVAEEYRICTGEHWTEGDEALAHPGYFDLHRWACFDDEPAYQHCWGTIDSSGNKTFLGCDPPE